MTDAAAEPKTGGDREAVVDAFLLVPVVACKQFEDGAGRHLALCHDMQSAATTWEEE